MLRTTGGILLSLFLAACATGPIVRTGVPEDLVEAAEVPSMPQEIRFWGDEAPPFLDAIASKRADQLRARYVKSRPPRTLKYLSVSGGGADGAYGAGLLVGWSETGKRPEFSVVTGISTGALIAPFAFLGPAYDEQLKTVYTTISTKNIATPQVLAALTGGPALASDRPLQEMIAQFATEDLLAEIARQHQLGRRLLIGTTNLDAARPVIWDMGEIASSGHPDALQLFRQVLLASASIPGVFPPVVIDVAADGQTYQELHVDGGVSTQVFLFPTQVKLKGVEKKYGFRLKRRIYVIRNHKLNPEWELTDPKLLKITGRSLSTLMRYQGIGDLIRLYARAKRDRMDYNLNYIPPTFVTVAKEPFDQAYMQELFDVGYEIGRAGGRWHKAPPGFEQ